jgi:hypothetical protein
MRTIRKFAYSAVLALSIFAVQPTLAAAEEARGNFTLSHEVNWQKYVLAAGDYTFSLKTIGASQFLVLRGSNGAAGEAMLLVSDIESTTANEGSRLELVSRQGHSFVNTMTLPESDMTLRFVVPPKVGSK